MAKTKQNFQEKLQQLEAHKQELILKRRRELLALIEKTGHLGTDDQLLAGALAFLKKHHDPALWTNDIRSIMEVMRSYGAPIFRTRTSSKKQQSGHTLPAPTEHQTHLPAEKEIADYVPQ